MVIIIMQVWVPKYSGPAVKGLMIGTHLSSQSKGCVKEEFTLAIIIYINLLNVCLVNVRRNDSIAINYMNLLNLMLNA